MWFATLSPFLLHLFCVGVHLYTPPHPHLPIHSAAITTLYILGCGGFTRSSIHSFIIHSSLSRRKRDFIFKFIQSLLLSDSTF